jgi:hypothetical protein
MFQGIEYSSKVSKVIRISVRTRPISLYIKLDRSCSVHIYHVMYYKFRSRVTDGRIISRQRVLSSPSFVFPPLSRLCFDTMSHFNRNVRVFDGRTRLEIAGDLNPYHFVRRINNVPARRLLAVWSDYHRDILPMDPCMHSWTRFYEIISMRK